MRLEDFVAPFRPAQIASQKQRETLPLTIGTNPRWQPDFFSWSDLLTIATNITDPDEIYVTIDRKPLPFIALQKNGTITQENIERLAKHGASILIQSAHRYEARFATLLQEYLDLSGEPSWFGVIGSTGSAGVLNRHADVLDLHVVQMEGEKLWRFYESEAEDAKIIREHVLKPGEYIYVPRGTFHECDTISGPSMHIGFGFNAPNYKIWK